MKCDSLTAQLRLCFSRVELAIALIIAGLLLLATLVSRESGQEAEVRMAYRKVVVPCVAALQEALRQGLSQAQATYPETPLAGEVLHCVFDSTRGGVIDRLTLPAAPRTLQEMMRQNLADGGGVVVEGNTVVLGRTTPPEWEAGGKKGDDSL
ncbi:MAG: hypothetical protein H7837_08750 [Magnetococcus sp. MYC-9]